jgi:hypothetical protein
MEFILILFPKNCALVRIDMWARFKLNVSKKDVIKNNRLLYYEIGIGKDCDDEIEKAAEILRAISGILVYYYDSPLNTDDIYYKFYGVYSKSITRVNYDCNCVD